MAFTGQGQPPPIVLGCRPVKPFQQEAGKASAGGPLSESSVLIQMKVKRPFHGGPAAVPAPSRGPQRLTRMGGASNGLAHLVKRERQSLVHSGLGT